MAEKQADCIVEETKVEVTEEYYILPFTGGMDSTLVLLKTLDELTQKKNLNAEILLLHFKEPIFIQNKIIREMYAIDAILREIALRKNYSVKKESNSKSAKPAEINYHNSDDNCEICIRMQFLYDNEWESGIHTAFADNSMYNHARRHGEDINKVLPQLPFKVGGLIRRAHNYRMNSKLLISYSKSDPFTAEEMKKLESAMNTILELTYGIKVNLEVYSPIMHLTRYQVYKELIAKHYKFFTKTWICDPCFGMKKYEACTKCKKCVEHEALLKKLARYKVIPKEDIQHIENERNSVGVGINLGIKKKGDMYD